MKEEDIRHYSIDEIEQMIARGEDKTDGARLNVTTDEEIEEAIKDDPDWESWNNVDWSKALWSGPRVKRAVLIRLDEDIIAFFKKDGPGYQSRMNAVLRYYIENQRKAAE